MNRRTWAFKKCLAKLPKLIQEAAAAAFELFLQNPAHRSLSLHEIHLSSKSGLPRPTFSVYITKQYRALYTIRPDGTNLWFWIGTHAEYDTIIGK